jgi:hypothetical protein
MWGRAAQAREYPLKASVDCRKQKYPQDQRPGLHEGYDRELCQLGYYGLHRPPLIRRKGRTPCGRAPRIVLLIDTIARVNSRKNEESRDTAAGEQVELSHSVAGLLASRGDLTRRADRAA